MSTPSWSPGYWMELKPCAEAGIVVVLATFTNQRFWQVFDLK